jgi:hypothetical protein
VARTIGIRKKLGISVIAARLSTLRISDDPRVEYTGRMLSVTVNS